MATTSTSANASDRPKFGLDAPKVVRALVISGLLGTTIASAIAFLLRVKSPGLSWYFYSHAAQSALTCFIPALLMIRSSHIGKPRVVNAMLNALNLRGDEIALDAGCGRGQVLVELAKRLPYGMVTGIDAWNSTDLSKNSQEAVQQNATLAGVPGRIQIDTGDIRSLPYDDASFEIITANLVVHNLRKKEERQQALDELLRVLKPGGRLILIDFRYTPQYVTHLRASCTTQRSKIFWQMFPPVRIVTAQRTSQQR